MKSWQIALLVFVCVAFGVTVYLFIQTPKKPQPVGTLAPFITTDEADDYTDKQYCTTIKGKRKEPKLDSRGNVIPSNIAAAPDVTTCSKEMQEIPKGCKVISSTKWDIVLTCDTPMFTPSRTPLPSFTPTFTPTLKPFNTTPTPTRSS